MESKEERRAEGAGAHRYLAEKENQKSKGNENKRGRQTMDISKRKGEKMIYGGHYLPVCVYVEKDLLQQMADVKRYGWSRRAIIEQGIIRMLGEIERVNKERVNKETIKRVQEQEAEEEKKQRTRYNQT